ncbi:MAG TPA: HAMP domain-containing sensor histidine kinase [Vicinamibacterales bacterium]|nr:HAMP domain-containing sensor histidine kinase [Vicinamibacterales bacterium]
MTSLRSRLFAGAVLWTIGLFLLTAVVHMGLVLHFRGVPQFLQGLFSHGYIVSAVGLACLAAGLFQVRRGLLSVDQLRSRLAAVHDGREAAVGGTYPSEVQPLVDDLNALLDQRERTVRRAIAKAGDLAHGLKTPLAVLAHEAEDLRTAGQGDLAATIGEQVERMRRQVEYHLAHARAAAAGRSSGARSTLVESAEGLARTLLRLHAGRGLAIDVRVPVDHVVRVQREDLDEMLGNLLDNACRCAASRVVVMSAAAESAVMIDVEDDGPGLPESMRESVLQRGVRADEAAPGSGLGLAIVRELAELYGGAIALEQSPLGGLRARLRLPAA